MVVAQAQKDATLVVSGTFWSGSYGWQRSEVRAAPGIATVTHTARPGGSIGCEQSGSPSEGASTRAAGRRCSPSDEALSVARGDGAWSMKMNECWLKSGCDKEAKSGVVKLPSPTFSRANGVPAEEPAGQYFVRLYFVLRTLFTPMVSRLHDTTWPWGNNHGRPRRLRQQRGRKYAAGSRRRGAIPAAGSWLSFTADCPQGAASRLGDRSQAW